MLGHRMHVHTGAVADLNDLLLDRVADLCEGLGDADTPLIFATPGEYAQHVDPRTVQTTALKILDQALVDAANGQASRLIFTMPPQEGKSWRVSRAFPGWLLHRNPDLRIGIVSYAETLAMTAAGMVKTDIEMHPELGLVLSSDTRAKGEWRLRGHDGGIIARGIGGGLTGRPIDVLIIDDPFKDRKEADSEVFRERAWAWWQQVGSARLGGTNTVVILVMTRWHEDDLAGRLLAQDEADGVQEWRLINIPAQADHDPEAADRGDCHCAGQRKCAGSDPLDRTPGEFMESARGRTTEQWEKRKRTAGSFAWAALYQGHPSPGEGGVLKRRWWRFFDQPRWVRRSDGSMFIPGAPHVELHVDCAFKDLDTSDFVALEVWVRTGPRLWLADVINDRLDVVDTCNAIIGLRAKWPQIGATVVEDKANGPAVIQVLRRKIPGVVEYTPEGSKLARAFAAAPYVEAGDVQLPAPELLPGVGDFLEQCAAFPQGANDDMVDALTQAVHRMLIIPFGSGFMDELLNEQGGAEGIIDESLSGRAWNPQGVIVPEPVPAWSTPFG